MNNKRKMKKKKRSPGLIFFADCRVEDGSGDLGQGLGGICWADKNTICGS
jgi:hypothetical protein